MSDLTSDWTTDRDAEGIICSIFHLKSARESDGIWEAQFFGGTYAPLEVLVDKLMAAIHAGDVDAARQSVDMSVAEAASLDGLTVERLARAYRLADEQTNFSETIEDFCSAILAALRKGETE